MNFKIHKHNWQFAGDYINNVPRKNQEQVMFICECGTYKLVKLKRLDKN